MIQRCAATVTPVGASDRDRVGGAVDVQCVLRDFRCDIRTGVGLHDADGRVCGPGGVILLQFVGGEESCDKLATRPEAVAGVEVKRLVFAHEG